MEKIFNGTLTFHFESFDGIEFLSVKSYNTPIARSYYVNEQKQENISFCDMHYYSQTTRIHQGIARAVLGHFDSVMCKGIVWDKIKSARSLRDLKRIFGYVPTKY